MRKRIIILALVLAILLEPSSATAGTRTITSRLDFDAGYNNNTEGKSKEGEIKLKADVTWGARVFKTPKLGMGNQTGIVSDGNYIYALFNYDRYFARYLPNEDRWQELTKAPHTAYNGADLTLVGNYIYAIYGGYQRELSRYSIINNSWEDLANAPDLFVDGSAIVSDGTYLYATRGNWTTDFWKYDPTTNTWASLTNPPAGIQQGSDMLYKDGALYVPRGYYRNFYKYDIATSTWSSLTDIPTDLYPMYGNHSLGINGDYIYFTRDYSSTQTFYRYQISANSWEQLTNLPQTTGGAGSVYNAADGYLYVFRGNGTYDFWKYDISANSFVGLTDLPNSPTTGGDLLYYGGYLYFPRGGSQSFYRYNLSTNSWETRTNTPAAFSDDTKGVVAGSYLYFLRGGGSNNLYRYDPSGDSWTTMTNTTPATTYYGSTLVYPGSGDYLYATRGYTTRSFWRYTISTDTWDDPGVADLPDDAEAAYGSRMVSDGTDIYYIAGYGMTAFLKYTIGTNTWSTLGTVPFSPYYGTDLSYNNGKIYAQAGYLKPDVWEYTIATATWRWLGQMQAYGATEIGPWGGGALETDASGNFYIVQGNGIVRMLNFTPSSYNYPASGTWTSPTYDLTYVASYTSLSSTATTPGDSTITYQARSSADQITWTGWETITGGVFPPEVTANRYLQIRATLNATSDRTQTPTLKQLVVTYAGDTTAPTNPSTITAKSQAVGGVTLTTGESYSYHQPYFTWSGAIDADTNVAGYYVYFGTSVAADPETDGNYQTSATYTATVQMSTGTYYLRLKTKDTIGNISTAATGFTYVYAGVSPPQTLTQTTSADFAAGTATNVATTSNQIKLASKAGFWQEARLSVSPAGVYYGSDFAYVASTNKLYLLRGYGSTTFYEYDIATDVWAAKAVAPEGTYYGASLIEGPAGYLYALKGYNSNKFWLYDIAANSWNDAAAADLPQTAYTGASIVYDGSRYIYALRGNGDDAFYRYDTELNLWEQKANLDFGAPTTQVNNVISDGADLAYDGADTIYVIQGARTGFASYSISGNSWTTLTNTPSLIGAGAKIEYDSTTSALYYFPGGSDAFFYRYNLSTQSWSELAEMPVTISGGSTMRNVDGILYVMRGGGNNTFYKYNITKASWLIPNTNLFSDWFRGSYSHGFGYGADIIKGDANYFYLAKGNFDNLFIRYNGATGEATRMADAPFGSYYGAELVYDSINGKIYATAGIFFRKFFVYDIATDSWSEETSDPPPYDSANDSALAYDGSRYIYWIRSGNTQTFYRFDTQGSSGAKWAALTNTPGTMGWGADLVYKDDYIYALRGNNTVGFYRYGPLSGTPVWSDPLVADLPTGALIYNDGFLADGGGDYLYACRGGNTVGCYRYSISGNSWEAIANAPAQIYTGGAGAGNGTDKMLAIAGGGTNTYSNGLYTYILQTDTSAFEESGNYVSPSHDLTATYRYANIDLTYTTATNASLTVYTSSSSDNSTWSDWSEASEIKNVETAYTYKINSQAARYLKVKFSLTSSDGVYSGTISDYTINYYQDITQPSNSTDLDSYNGASMSASLTTNTWYNHTGPYFDWPEAEAANGASDGAGGSEVAGYYVYFGTDQDANASISGTLTTNSNYTASSLTSGTTYYLRLQTVDSAGNYSAQNWQPFIYKFDNTAPTNPTTVTADPPGYTATNNFTFSWSGATDSASLVSEYCYKTGATGATETCTSEASASGALAYQTGTNVFYVRAKDTAANYASEYANASFYYSSTAPGAPQNLRVTYPVGSTSNTVNEFAFAWDAPSVYYGQQSGLRYYYSFNALPTANNVNDVGLSVTYLSQGSYATQKGTNTLYVVAQDEAGNIDYNIYASVTFTADTSAPGIVRNIDISDVSIKETSSWRLALSWDAPESTGSGVANYKVYRYDAPSSATVSLDCSSNFSSFSYIASTTQTSYVDTGLTQTRKYYCAKACDSTNECSAVSDTVNYYPDGKWRTAPTLTASPSATVKTKTAVITWSTNRTSNSFVKYSKTSGSYDEETGSSTQVTSHSVDLTGLDPGTTYYFKATWTDEDGNAGSSSEITFTTNPAPAVSTVKASNVGINSATITFTIANAIKATVEYGKTLTYGGTQSISTAKSESTYMVSLTNLLEGTAYNFRIKAEDDEANVYYSDNYTFETLPVPKITTLKVQQVIGMPTATLRLLWTSNTSISSIITYYPSKFPERAKDYINLTLKKTHEAIIKDLTDETEYTLIITGKDLVGNQAEYPAQKVKTATDFRPPLVENFNIETTITGVGDEARAKLVVSWDTDEPATTQVEYGQGTTGAYSQTTQEDKALTSNHTVTITGLVPATIYHLRALSKDKAKNIARSEDTVIITPKSTKGALELVVENLSKSFGFLKGVNIK